MNRPAVRLRPARASDLEALLALERRAFAGDRLSRRGFRHHLGAPSSALHVAVRDGALLGDVLLLFRRGSTVARLYSIAVAPEARGIGLGSRLLAHAERLARARGCDRLRLEVREDNAAAIALYAGRGYRPIGWRPGYYEDGAAARRYEKPVAPVRTRRRAAPAGSGAPRGSPPRGTPRDRGRRRRT